MVDVDVLNRSIQNAEKIVSIYLSALLNETKVQIKKCEGDGHCFFRVIYEVLCTENFKGDGECSSDLEFVAHLREMAADSLTKKDFNYMSMIYRNEEWWKRYKESHQLENLEDLKRWVENMQEPRFWAETVTIERLLQRLGFILVTCSSRDFPNDGNPREVEWSCMSQTFPSMQRFRGIILAEYNGVHYNAVEIEYNDELQGYFFNGANKNYNRFHISKNELFYSGELSRYWRNILTSGGNNKRCQKYFLNENYVEQKHTVVS